MNVPHFPEAEEAFVNIFLLHPQSTGALIAESSVVPEDFFSNHHRLMVSSAMDLWSQGKPVDFFSVSLDLKRRGDWEEVAKSGGNTCYLNGGPASAAEYYLNIIKDSSQLRKIALLCASTAQEAVKTGADPQKVLAGLGEGVTGISGASPKAPVKTMKELVCEKLRRIEENEEEQNVFYTEIEKLDLHSPVKLGDMPLISGERKSGKSILALNIALNAALRKEHVLYFSLEDKISKVVDRMFANVSQIPLIRHAAKGLLERDIQHISHAAMKLAETSIVIRDDLYELFPIVAVIRQEKTKFPDMKLVVIDYAQLIRHPMPKGSLQEQEIATISRTLRLLSMELNIVILLLCQLNKQGDTRHSKALEQDCTAMWKVVHCDPEDHGKRMLAIPFQRNGESGIAFPVSFFGATSRIETFHGEYEES